ncbi:nucleotidyltransferase domain-containing protein [Patescibacteria group bacterium]|nr:nucleotidyltransferase domain-containing protein [Patescibacteria group bacterium]
MSSAVSDKKWKKLLRYVRLFRLVPFVDFVLVAGSMATGEPREDSDFDVIVGVRTGRIFTARMGCFVIFASLGLWARHPSQGSRHSATRLAAAAPAAAGQTKDRFCFNHFVTPASYRLSPPHNTYWQHLYRSLVPVFGDPRAIQAFYDANAGWLNEKRSFAPDARFASARTYAIVRMKGWVLSGWYGDIMERFLKKIQLSHMARATSARDTYEPRLVISDAELEFHPHTKRIKEYVDNL